MDPPEEDQDAELTSLIRETNNEAGDSSLPGTIAQRTGLLLLLNLVFFLIVSVIKTDVEGSTSIVHHNLAAEKVSSKIGINSNSMYALSDIAKILHIPSKSRIEVHLQPNRTCYHPVFIGRISGLSLSMIKFDNFDLTSSNTSTYVIGTYNLAHMPVSGKYFVEIIHLLCSEHYNKGYFRSNVRNVCLQARVSNTSIDDHRITHDRGSIDIDLNRTYKPAQKEKIAGTWLHKSFLVNKTDWKTFCNTTNKIVIPPPEHPLFTRYQPERNKCIHCSLPGARNDVDLPINQYNFHWDKFQRNVLKEYFLGNQKSETNVCFLGASHSIQLDESCNMVKEHTVLEAKKQSLLLNESHALSCTGIYANYPKNVTQNSKDLVGEIIKRKCTHLVIGLFQWFFSFQNSLQLNINISNWKMEMTKAVHIISKAAHDGRIPSLQRVVLRSAHTNGMGYMRTMCPPKDFRTPINALMATMVLEEIVEEFEHGENKPSFVSLVDTGSVINPVWDSAKDWSHYTGEHEWVETIFLLSEILK